MTQRIKKNISMLNALCHCKSKKQQHILKVAGPDLVKAICDCALNVLRGTIPITSDQKKKLRPFKNVLRSLADPKKTVASKKKLLVQRGGSPLMLIPLLAPIIKQVIDEIS